MKIEIDVNKLNSKLSFLNHAVSTKSQLPVLLNILLEAKDNRLKLSSTDLEIGIETYIPAIVSEEGGGTVTARTFTELINSISDTTIIIQVKEGILEVIGKKIKSVFQVISRDDFPKLYEDKGELVTKIKSNDLKKAFSSVIFSASTDTTRPALSGVLVKKEESGFLLVATDGFRLSLKHYEFRIDDGMDGSKSFIVPARVFRELMSIKEDDDFVKMYVSENSNQVLFEIGATCLVGRLIEAEFPKYEKIIPSDFSLSVSFDRKELLSAVKVCSIFARDSANIIKLSLYEDHVVVSSSSPSVGQNTVNVGAKLDGEENEIAFNAKYLLDILGSLDEDDLRFEMIGPLNPGVFRIEGDTSFLHLIMPIRTDQ